jgi:hypothetical protein
MQITYKLKLFVCAAALAGISFGALMPDASAKRRHHRHHHHAYPHVHVGPFDLGDRRIFVAGTVAGGASTGAYYLIRDRARYISEGGALGLTTVGCAVVGPMLAAAIVQYTENRPLTSREALGLGAGCFLPIIGSWLVDKAYDAHPEWERAERVQARGSVRVRTSTRARAYRKHRRVARRR